jgi:tRNA nucleotidyltransferase (CCA-adding enzyme)
MKSYIVGGAVRDRLLGLPVQDRDWVVVGATPEQMLARGFRQVGRDFPVFLHPKTHEEYALARTERKTGPGYTGFTVHAAPDVTLEEDLIRRDLTINAMAEDEHGALIDPYGGAADIERRVLRHVSPAFAEDPLRILRVARFAARFAPLGFIVAEETLLLMQAIVEAGEVATLAPERVWQETARALAEGQPSAYFEVLHACGALAVIAPEIDRLWGVPQSPEHHPEIDTGIHTMMVLEAAARLTPDTTVRFAALTHDLGKGATPESEWPRHFGHEERGAELVDGLCARLRVPNDHRDLALLAARHHGECHRALELRPGTVLGLLEALDAFRRPGRFELFLLACEADFRGRPGYEALDYPQAAWLRRAREAAADISGAALSHSGLTGKALGAAITERRTGVIAALARTEGREEE